MHRTYPNFTNRKAFIQALNKGVRIVPVSNTSFELEDGIYCVFGYSHNKKQQIWCTSVLVMSGIIKYEAEVLESSFATTIRRLDHINPPNGIKPNRTGRSHEFRCNLLLAR